MSAAAEGRALTRGSGLLIAHCHALGDVDEHVLVGDRRRHQVGGELSRLLLLALAGDHSMRSR